MDIHAIKIDLIHWLTELQDYSTLKQLLLLKDQHQSHLSETHKALLDERIASYHEDPTKALDWDDVVKELEKNL
jgi:hypothetical protein